jgi:ubiquitin-protein ligase
MSVQMIFEHIPGCNNFFSGPITEDNFFEWEAAITGPEGTPFEVFTPHFLVQNYQVKRTGTLYEN